VREYFVEHADALMHMVNAVKIYTGRCYNPKKMRKFLRKNPITRAFAIALYERRELMGKDGLREIIVNENNPELLKTDPYVVSTIAAVGEVLKEEEKKTWKSRFLEFFT